MICKENKRFFRRKALEKFAEPVPQGGEGWRERRGSNPRPSA
jgi:hypothetical protein